MNLISIHAGSPYGLSAMVGAVYRSPGPLACRRGSIGTVYPIWEGS
jgi:hypothetical protein